MEYRYNEGLYIYQRPSRCSVVLKNVFKTHDKETVFKGVTLTAHSGKICAILGEINSGKSMLLSCLVGSDKVDKGHIWVLGGRPRTKSSKTLTHNVGYMPQELCLYKSMTILELFTFYGHLYNISHTFIEWRIRYFNEMFSLPEKHTRIKNLSFSKKKMISFMISVFHRPRLVVLDEPTVGLDVFKQRQIWKFLNRIATTWKPTIILATNSVEEAFLATKIAYLKDGQIVFEREVVELQQTFPNKPINIIVQDLCTDAMSDLDGNEFRNNQTEVPHNRKLRFYSKIKPRSNIWKLKTIIFHDMKFLTRNIWIFILLCVIPTLQVTMHCLHYGAYPHPMPVAVYNQETNCLDHVCEQIQNCAHFSCNFLNVMATNNIKVEYYGSESLARDSVTKELTLGFVRVPKNYTELIVASLTQKVSSEEHNALSKNGIYIEIDMSRYKFKEFLKEHLHAAHKLHLTKIYSFYNLSTKYAEIPIKIYEYENLDHAENTAAEIISCAIFSSATFNSALLLQNEIQNGYMVRNIIAGVTIFEIILSFIIIQTIFSTIQAFSYFFLVDLLLHISWRSSLLLIILINNYIGICGMSIGLLIGSFTKSPMKIFHILLFVYCINIIISGIYWPLQFEQFYVFFFLFLSPVTLPSKVIKALLIKGLQLVNNGIFYISIFVTVFWIIISFGTFFIKLKNKINFII